jgi:septum formation protein
MSCLILASSSPRRIQLLRAAKFNPEVIPPNIAEIRCEFLTPSELTRFNAYQKAASVAVRHPDAVVLAADTIVTLESEIFGKPRDLDDARRMLGKLVGKTHEVITGIALLEANIGRVTLEAEHSTVTFRPLSAAEIDEYLKVVNPLGKAGAYAAQKSAGLIIERIQGSFSNVVGLPMELIRPLLRSLGIHPVTQ